MEKKIKKSIETKETPFTFCGDCYGRVGADDVVCNSCGATLDEEPLPKIEKKTPRVKFKE